MAQAAYSSGYTGKNPDFSEFLYHYNYNDKPLCGYAPRKGPLGFIFMTSDPNRVTCGKCLEILWKKQRGENPTSLSNPTVSRMMAEQQDREDAKKMGKFFAVGGLFLVGMWIAGEFRKGD